MIFFYLVLVDVFVVYTKRILKIAIYWNCANAVSKYIKNQKSIRESIARMSSKLLFRIQDDINSHRQQLLLITSGLQRNAVAVEKLKKETAQVLFMVHNLCQ